MTENMDRKYWNMVYARDKALEIAKGFGQTDGDHHKAWVIDQIVRALLDCPMVEKEGIDWSNQLYTYLAMGESDNYRKFIAEARDGEDGPETYGWNVGVAP